MEEERRLAYVGMTRARQKLWLTYTRMRRVWGQEQFNPPSRFIKEIPQNLVEFKTAVDTNRFVSRYGSDSSSMGAGSWGSTGNANSDRNRMRAGGGDDFQSFPDYDDDMSSSSSDGNLPKGARVRHPTFGVGTVYSTEGNGDNFKVSVMFADKTIKKFVAKYARLERV
ncbi:DNA helicase II [compost metagenome]